MSEEKVDRDSGSATTLSVNDTGKTCACAVRVRLQVQGRSSGADGTGVWGSRDAGKTRDVGGTTPRTCQQLVAQSLVGSFKKVETQTMLGNTLRKQKLRQHFIALISRKSRVAYNSAYLYCSDK